MSCASGFISIIDPFLNPDGSASDAVSQPDGPSGNAYITTYYVLFEVGA